jgi:hypothetical protein
LPFNVDFTHINNAFQTEAGAGRSRCYAMLPRTGFGNNARLAHAAGEQNLAQHIVDLVRASMIQLVTLQVNLGPAYMLGQALGKIKRAGTANIMGMEGRQFRMK